MEKLCKNCKHYVIVMGDNCAFCEMVVDDVTEERDKLIVDDIQYVCPSFPKNFGCIHFESREPEYNIPA